MLKALGQQSAKLAERKLAHQLDPLNFTASGAVVHAYFYLGQYDQAIAECKRALELNPDFLVTRKTLGVAYEAKRMYPEAIAEYIKAKSLPTWDTLMRFPATEPRRV
jgi:tetratricopeptide (TPR) repeat protein